MRMYIKHSGFLAEIVKLRVRKASQTIRKASQTIYLIILKLTSPTPEL